MSATSRSAGNARISHNEALPSGVRHVLVELSRVEPCTGHGSGSNLAATNLASDILERDRCKLLDLSE